MIIVQPFHKDLGYFFKVCMVTDKCQAYYEFSEQEDWLRSHCKGSWLSDCISMKMLDNLADASDTRDRFWFELEEDAALFILKWS